MQPRDRHKREEDDDTDAVVEQRLTGDLRFEAGRGAELAQEAHHCDWIGRRNQRAEHQRDHQRNRDAQQPEAPQVE